MFSKSKETAIIEPLPIVKEGIESWKDVLRLIDEKRGYEDFLNEITGLTRDDVERLVRKEERGADLKIPIPKGTVLTNTGKDYKVYPNFKMPRDRIALTDENKELKVLTWCGNPIKDVKFSASEVILFTLSNLENGFLPSSFDPLGTENKAGSKFKTEIWTLNLATKEVYPLVKGSGGAGYSQHAAHPAVSPNGRYLVFTWIG